MTHRLPVCVAFSLLLGTMALGAPAAGAATPGGWNLGEQRAVRLAGVMHNLDDAAFHGERPVTGHQLTDALGALATRLGVQAGAAVPAPASTVSVTTFDRLLVRQLGAGDVAAAVQHEAWRAGLQPPATFGTEVVARFLELRSNHPFGQEQLELYPTEPITRAEAAHSFAAALKLGLGGAEWARSTFSTFALPRYSAAHRRVLRLAISKIGMPYVWGGETDTASGYFGGQVHGGYDCSGFVWRVFKLSGFSWGRAIRGRTAAQQAGEIPASARIRLDAVRPADLLFFGPGRFWQKATERRIVHEGLALSSTWAINSSGQGVYVLPLTGDSRLAREFSWARRVL